MITSFLLAVFTYYFAAILQPLFCKLQRENYQGKPVPTGLGIAFVLPAVISLVSGESTEHVLPFAVLILSFAFLGFVDDTLGDDEKKGFTGHFKSGEISTGGLKALGEVAVAAAIGSIYASTWIEALINGLVMALSANFLNLLDLRPGRAGKTFLLLGLPFFLKGAFFLFCLGAGVLGYLPWDLQGRMMMGDSGSNALGAALGFALITVSSRGVKLAFFIGLLALNFLAERISFSTYIRSNRFLRFLDDLGRNLEENS